MTEERTKYPYQVFAVVRQQTFAVDAKMSSPEKNSQPPLEFHHSKFSRFTFAVLKGKGDSVSANLKVKTVPYLVEQSKACLQQEMIRKFTGSAKKSAANSIPSTPAYMLTFMAGPYKGKSPASVAVMENGINLLRDQYKQLQSNLDKYPNNQKLMDAIVEAVDLQKDGKLVAKETSDDVAYTVSFKSGNLKGKTPAQVLLEDPTNGENTLQGQRSFLAKNVAKYPANQEVIDAIDAAIRLFEAGMLSAEEAESSATSIPVSGFVLHDADFLCYVNKNKPGYDPNELEDISHLQIVWDFGNKYPVCIFIENYQAKVAVGSDGKQNVVGEHVNSKQMKMLLTAEEWMDCLYHMQATMRNFEMLHAKDAFADAARIDKENADASKAAKGQN